MKPKVWVRIVFCMIVFSVLLQIGGLVSPLWIWLHTDDFTVGVGLYYRIGCEATSGGNCTQQNFPPNLPFGYDSESTYNTRGWEAVVWTETIASALGLILMIMMLVYMVGFGHWRKLSVLNVAMTIVAIMTWLPLIAGLIVYAVEFGKVITRSPDVSSVSFPWSLLMCAVAGLLFIIITILIRLRCKARNYIKHAIPASADSKMALNPFTKSQVMKRYFTPSPYREERRQALYSSAYYTDQSHLLGNGFTSGAIESTNYDNRALENRAQSRGIEYNVVDRTEMPSNQVIQTNNLTTGTYMVGGTGQANNTAVNNDFRGTIFEKDLGSSVRRNTGEEDYGTRVVERTYVTRTGGSANYVSNYGNNAVDRSYVSTTQIQQPQVTEVSRQEKWQSAQNQITEHRGGQKEEKIVGHQVTLNKHGGYDAFSDIDAETIYYTGNEGYTPSGFLGKRDAIVSGSNAQDVTYSRVVQRDESRKNMTNGYLVTTQEYRPPPPQPPPPPPMQEETVVREITVYEREGGQYNQENKHFRIPADYKATQGLQESQHYTVHTRMGTENQAVDGVLLAPGQLDGGDKFKYNGTYIYRPYAEEIY